MSLRKCPGCRAEFRKGQVVMMLEGGSLAGRVVCQTCANKGVVIVAPQLPPGPVLDPTKAEKKEQRDVLQPFIDNVKTKVAAIRAVPQARCDDFQDGRLEAYEAVLAMLLEGRA